MFPGLRVACVISIGTGQARAISVQPQSWFQRTPPLDLDVVETLRAMAADCEQSAQDITWRFQDTPNVYFRFNVEQGLQTVGLAEWGKLDEVTAHTEQYMKMVEVDQRLGAAVVALQGRQSDSVQPQHNNQVSLFFPFLSAF
jgi:hypothetical protein